MVMVEMELDMVRVDHFQLEMYCAHIEMISRAHIVMIYRAHLEMVSRAHIVMIYRAHIEMVLERI